MEDSNSKILENLTPREKERIVAMLARYIIEKKKEQERLDRLKKI